MRRPETKTEKSIAARRWRAGLAMAVGVGAASAARAADPPQAPAPVGVFGADMPAGGKFVFSFLPSFARSQGSMIGSRWVEPSYIVTHVGSAYTPVGQHLLRMVPKALSVNTQGFAVAYGLNSDVTLFASTAIVEKSVNMQAFRGLSGSAPLGFRVGSTQGLGDTTLATIVRLHHDRVTRLNVNLGLSLPTGSTTDSFALLLPNNTAPVRRGFYAMQPGSGTVDLMPGVAYSGVKQAWSWGLSYRARLPLNRGAQGWRYGDLHEFNGWGGYTWLPGLETTLRVNGSIQGRIQGDDSQIRGYAQGSTPLFYGGRQVSVFGGLIVSGRFVHQDAASLGVEAGVPVYQSLNGPQLARDWQVNVALRYKL